MSGGGKGGTPGGSLLTGAIPGAVADGYMLVFFNILGGTGIFASG